MSDRIQTIQGGRASVELNNKKPTLLRIWPQDESDAAKLIRAYPWSKTSLGALEEWPERLKGAVDLRARLPLPDDRSLGSPSRINL